MGAPAGGGIQQRNPVMVLVLSMVCPILAIMNVMGFFADLEKAAPESANKFAWWMLLIPIYGIILFFTKLMPWVADAKRKYGCNPPQNIVMYLFLSPYAFAVDLNEIGAKMGG